MALDLTETSGKAGLKIIAKKTVLLGVPIIVGKRRAERAEISSSLK